MMVNEVYFCLVFEGLKNKTKNQKRKDSAMMSLGQRVAALRVPQALQLVP